MSNELRNGLISGTLAALAIVLAHMASVFDSISNPDTIPFLVAWLAISLFLGGLSGLFGGFISLKLRIGDSGFLLGILSAGFIYLVQCWVYLAYAINNPVIVP
jgi:hypothetical protein